MIFSAISAASFPSRIDVGHNRAITAFAEQTMLTSSAFQQNKSQYHNLSSGSPPGLVPFSLLLSPFSRPSLPSPFLQIFSKEDVPLDEGCRCDYLNRRFELSPAGPDISGLLLINSTCPSFILYYSVITCRFLHFYLFCNSAASLSHSAENDPARIFAVT